MHYRIIGDISACEEHLEFFNAMLNDKDDTVLIEISSLGGELDALMLYLTRLHEVKAKGKKLVCWASGPACSAAATILWQADEIYVSPASLVMYHDSCEYIVHGPLTTLWLVCIDKWKAFKTGKSTDFSTFSDKIFNKFEPWDLILKAYGDKVIKGDYYFTAKEFADLAPEKVKVGFPPYKLALYGEEPSDIEELREAMAEALEECEDEFDEDDDTHAK